MIALVVTLSLLVTAVLCALVLGSVLMQAHRGGDLVLSERNEARWDAAEGAARVAYARVRTRVRAPFQR